ncbi:MAG: flavin reductase [Actinobacteria bacterium]|nr:MAG: flavin reductase [Actinomycetota bacterium]
MIHDENPFASTADDPFRRFRGRLAAPVTIITSGEDRKTGLTVSSLFVVEGDPPLVYAVVGPNSDLFDAVQETGKFVVHIAREGHEGVAEVFAGLRPSPGGLFSTVEWEPSAWGPLLESMPDRALCTVVSMDETGWSGVLTGSIDELQVADITSPLVHFRGKYRRLA